MARVLIEVCVDDSAGLAQAVLGAADRVELCAALALGGLTPSAGFMAEAARAPLPVFAMIRPRAGDFGWSEAEVQVMEADIATARQAGLAGVVMGASLPDGRLDTPVLQRLIRAADGMGLTLHRALDLTPDMPAALEQAAALGFHRVLTSGGAVTAPEGRAMLARLMAQAAGRITVMPGAGITAQSVAVLRDLPLTEVHASCGRAVDLGGKAAALGFGGAGGLRRTDAGAVRALRAALQD